MQRNTTRLRLRTETIRQLTGTQLSRVDGGGTITQQASPTTISNSGSPTNITQATTSTITQV
jgi:hypothetical protein